MKRVALVFSLICVLALTASKARAVVIFDSFDPGGGFSPDYAPIAAGLFPPPEFPPNWIRSAVQFPVAGGDFNLTSVTLPIAARKLQPGNFLRVRLTKDVENSPGQTLEVLSSNEPWPIYSLPFTTASTLTSTVAPLLLEGERYWIVAELSGRIDGLFPEEYDWFASTNQPSVLMRWQTAWDNPPQGDSWGVSGGMNLINWALRVEGTPAPPRLSITRGSASQVELCWRSRSNVAYQIQCCLALMGGTWTNSGAPIPGDGSQKCQPIPLVAGEPDKFYRIVALP